MAKKKKKTKIVEVVKPDLGLTTFSDMMTLCLTFFILLFTMSEIKQDRVTSTMDAFQRQIGVLAFNSSAVQVFIPRPRLTQTDAYVLRRGQPGNVTNVETIRQNFKMKQVIGGTALFAANSSELLPTGKQELANSVAPHLQGYKNRIDIQGHTASTASSGESYIDHWDLAFRRAYAVMRYLVDECGIEERRFRVTSCGDKDPIASNDTANGRDTNRRVEIIMAEDLVADIGVSPLGK